MQTNLMDIIVKKINNKDIWQGFLLGVEEKTFLQSWNWGEFQRALGHKIWRFGFYEKEELIGLSLVVKIAARRGTFLFVPHGPALRSSAGNSKFKILNILLHKLKKIAKEEKCSFIRIAPIWRRTEENKKIFRDLGFRQAPLYAHPELTWQLNLEKSEKDLLMQMRKTTRYLIRQGLKNKDLEIESSQDIKTIEIFNNIYEATASRHDFVPFSLKYLKNEFKAFASENQMVIFLARYKGEYIAGAIIIYWQNIGFYHQGASLQKYAKIPGSYPLQWEAIKEAKKRGCQLYNFWGIADVESKECLKNHPWAGLTLFKKGFGGYKNPYVKTQDLPLSKKYLFCYVVEKIRKFKRGV